MSHRPRLRAAFRTLLLIVLATVLFVVGWVLTHRDTVRGYRQAAVVGARLTTHSQAQRWTGPLAHDVQPAQLRQIGEYPATVVRPTGTAPLPAVVIFVTGAVTQADISRAQHALAAGGMSVWAVRTPEFDEILLRNEASQMVDQVADHVAGDPGTRDRHVSLIAAGPVASLALQSAARGSSATADIRAIIAAQPIADLRVLIRRALTDATFDPDVRRQAGRALARVARERVGQRSRLVGLLLDRAIESDDPITQLRVISPDLAPPSLRGMLTVLHATTPDEFDTAWPQVPAGLRARVARSSPALVAEQVTARVLLVDDARPGSITAPDVAALSEQLRDTRTITIDPSAAASTIDVRGAFGTAAWWLERAGD